MEGNRRRKVVVVGGGITGMSAAWYLSSGNSGKSLDIELVEKDDRLGGKISTLVQDGFVIEQGPDSFLARKTAMLELVRELSLDQELVGTDPSGGTTYILHRGRFHRMPPGLVMGIPTRVSPFLSTGLLTWTGKIRAALDLILPRNRSQEDESLGQFLRRRLGRQVQENIAEPLLSGIYAGDPTRLSLRSTFPQFKQIEDRHRSLILGMSGQRRASRSAHPAPEVPEHVRGSTFLTCKGGLAAIVSALERHLRQRNVEINTGIGLQGLQPTDYGGCELRWDNGKVTEADAVILALPAFQLERLLPDWDSVRQFASMPYASVANVVLAYDRSELASVPDASGYLIPRKENRNITACTVTSVKWPHSSPQDKLLIRCYIGRTGEEQWMEKDDDALVRIVRDEVQSLLRITAEPVMHIVNRWVRSMPQYTAGHQERVRRLREELSRYMPGVVATGSAFAGIGLPDCVRQGKQAAEQISSFLQD